VRVRVTHHPPGGTAPSFPGHPPGGTAPSFPGQNGPDREAQGGDGG
jgi:hypothetical protein